MVKCEKAILLLDLRVGADGKVKGCEPQQSSAPAELTTKSCEIAAKNFRFKPKREDGKAVEFTQTVKIVYVMHGEAPPAESAATPQAPQ